MLFDKKLFIRGPWSLVSFSWAAVLCTLLFISGPYCKAAHADYAVSPSIAVSEEYNDNIFETNDRKTDYVTSVMPGIILSYNAPFWDWDLNYILAYRYFAHKSQDNDFANNLKIRGLTRLIDNFLFLDLSDNYNRVSLNLAQDKTMESTFVNQSDTNNFTASPFLQFHPVAKIKVITGYRYINVWYKVSQAISRRDHEGFMEATYELSPKLDLLANYTYTLEKNAVNPYERHDPNLGFKYEYKEDSTIFAEGGYTWLSPKYGGVSNDPFWNAGITHSFDHFTISLASGVQYPFDPLSGLTKETDYTFSANKKLSRGNIGVNLSYSKFVQDTSIQNLAFIGPQFQSLDIKSRYSGGISASHELLQDLNATLSGSYERYEHVLEPTYTRRYYANADLTYTFPQKINLTLTYNYVKSYSPLVQSDNYYENRVSLTLSKSFGKVLERQPIMDRYHLHDTTVH